MSLSKLLMPEDVVLSHNVIPVNVETDKYRTTLGTKQVLRIFTTGNTTAGKKITIQFKDFDMELTFATTPDDSGLQLPLYDGAISTGYDTLITALKSNYYLDRYYVITLSTSLVSGFYQATINFTQRSFGQEFAAVSISDDDSTNFVTSIPTAQVMPSYGANFRFLCDLYYQSNPTLSRSYSNLVAQLDASGNDENIGQFNLSEIFKNWDLLKPDFPSDVSFQQCPNVLKNYYLLLAESYGSPETARNNITEPSSIAANTYKQVILGGLPYLKWPSNTFMDDYIDAAIVKFLTVRKSGKIHVPKQMPNWFSFYLKSSVTDLVLKVKLYMSDGTNTTVSKATFSGTTDQKSIWQVAVGYDQLDIDSDLTPTTEPVKYEFWIEDGAADQITEKFVLMMDTRYNEYNSYFFFHNYLGGIDVLWCSGQSEFLPEYSGNEVAFATKNDYTEGNFEAKNSKTRFSFSFNSGNKSNIDETNCFLEMIQSNYVRLLPDPKLRPGFTDPTKLMKVVIDKSSIDSIPQDIQSIFSLKFVAKEGHNEW